MSFKTLHSGKPRRLGTKPCESFLRRFDYTGPLEEIVCSQGRGEAGRAAGGKDMVGTRQVIAQRGGRAGSEEDRAGYFDLPEPSRRLADFVTTQWEELGHPCTEAAVEHALACAARRIAAHDDERAVLVHGDVHQLNALQVPGRDTFKLVDPDGLFNAGRMYRGI